MGDLRIAAALLAAIALAGTVSAAARGSPGLSGGFYLLSGGDPAGLALALSSAGAVGVASALLRRLRRSR